MELLSPVKIKYADDTGSLLFKLPVSIFGAVMGLAGLSRAFLLAATVFGLHVYWANIASGTAFTIFIVLAIAYVLKCITYPHRVAADFNSPANGSFFGTIPIATLLLSTLFQPFSAIAYQVCWYIGTVMMLSLAYVTCYRLLCAKQEYINITPVLILPIVGVLNVAVTGGHIPGGWAHEINLMALSIGGILTVAFFTLIFSRLMHHDKLSTAMEPTLMILMSPFAVCFLAYVSVTNSVDLFATALYYFALFLFLVLFFRIFLNQRSFIHTWWSVGFPVAALTNSALKYALVNHNLLSRIIAGALLMVLTMLITYMLVKSLYLLYKKSLF